MPGSGDTKWGVGTGLTSFDPRYDQGSAVMPCQPRASTSD